MRCMHAVSGSDAQQLIIQVLWPRPLLPTCIDLSLKTFGSVYGVPVSSCPSCTCRTPTASPCCQRLRTVSAVRRGPDTGCLRSKMTRTTGSWVARARARRSLSVRVALPLLLLGRRPMVPDAQAGGCLEHRQDGGQGQRCAAERDRDRDWGGDTGSMQLRREPAGGRGVIRHTPFMDPVARAHLKGASRKRVASIGTFLRRIFNPCNAAAMQTVLLRAVACSLSLRHSLLPDCPSRDPVPPYLRPDPRPPTHYLPAAPSPGTPGFHAVFSIPRDASPAPSPTPKTQQTAALGLDTSQMVPVVQQGCLYRSST
jgi:hypothetical protein